MFSSNNMGVRRARRGQETSEQEGAGGGEQLVFEDRSMICLQPAIIYWQGGTRHPQLGARATLNFKRDIV